jgi:hypothetical protein
MKFAVVTLLAGTIMLAAPASAQKLELKFDALAAKASDKAELDLDGGILKLVMRHGLGRENDGKTPAGDWLSGIKAIHIRNYEFDQTGAYSEKDLEPLRKQVSEGSGWSRVVNIKEKDENTEIFVSMQGGNITSCLVVNAEARELTVVYLVGTLTLAQAKELADSDDLHGLTGMAEEVK